MSLTMTLIFLFCAVFVLVGTLGFAFDLHDARLRAAFARTMRAWAGAVTQWEWRTR